MNEGIEFPDIANKYAEEMFRLIMMEMKNKAHVLPKSGTLILDIMCSIHYLSFKMFLHFISEEFPKLKDEMKKFAKLFEEMISELCIEFNELRDKVQFH